MKCVITAKDICRFFGISDKDRDIVLAATILHDIKKNGDPWGNVTVMDHGKLGADFLDKFELKESTKTEIKNCIRYHLGRFTGTKEDVPRAMKPTQKEMIIQLTDLFCSRRYASWLPGVNVKDEDIQTFLSKVQPDLAYFL